ncbi:MAG: alpha/beta fold hydrolase [Oscillospiraceae bacterium]|jgi:carboxylesterase|nr:alpha/beta fold hydrolase [Oscillospiraceae bacterium]
MHLPQYFPRVGAKRIVVFIHGFMGGPDQFGELMEAVGAKGFSAASLLLPGHGGTGMAFARVTAEAWEEHVLRELGRFGEYDELALVGHSIGGLLALLAAVEGRYKIGKLVLLSTPLKVHLLHPMALARRLRVLGVPGELRTEYLRARSVKLFPWLPLYVRTLLQPHRLMRKTRARLGDVTVPTLIFLSERDETTSYKTAKLFAEGLTRAPHEIVTLRRSYHAHYTADERRLITARLLAFLDE